VTIARGEAPVLLLDDVFSELDDRRSAALLESLPVGQKILTTASGLPSGAVADVVVNIAGSRATVA
jgi:recombinational DNA repair ATPase RecF